MSAEFDDWTDTELRRLRERIWGKMNAMRARVEAINLELQSREDDQLFEQYGLRKGDKLRMTPECAAVILANGNSQYVVDLYSPECEFYMSDDDGKSCHIRGDSFSVGGIPIAVIVDMRKAWKESQNG